MGRERKRPRVDGFQRLGSLQRIGRRRVGIKIFERSRLGKSRWRRFPEMR